MKRLYLLTALAAMALLTLCPRTEAAVPETTRTEIIEVHTEYNAYGIAISSKSTTTTATTTIDINGAKTTEVEITNITSTWHGGSLKADTRVVKSAETDSTGKKVSERNYTDTFTYDTNGNLLRVSGSGEVKTYDADTGYSLQRKGKITRSFVVKDGQALLTGSTTSGDIFGKTGKIGTFVNTTVINEADYQYLGGQWVPVKQKSTSYSLQKDGSFERITRTTTYQRDDQGVITGMSQTADGGKLEIRGAAGEERAEIAYILTGYDPTFAFNPQMGWYLAEEDITWLPISKPEE